MYKRVVTASVLGGILEFYEFTVFGFLSALLIPLFFPSSPSPLTNFFLIFAAGFLARPLGSLFFGYIGDQLGRRKALSLSLLLMTFATVSIGLLPTEQSIGPLAGYLLVFLRILQGFSAGGEFAGGIVFSTDHADWKKRAFISSLVSSGCMMGILLGNIVGTFTKEFSTYEFAWRIPFLSGLFLGLIGLYCRYQLEESTSFKQAKSQNKAPLVSVLKYETNAFIDGILISGFAGMLCFMNTVYISAAPEIQISTILPAFLMMLLQPFSALFADRHGARKTLSFLLLTLLTIGTVFFIAVHFKVPLFYQKILFIGFAILTGLFFGPIHTIILKGFSVRTRFTGYSFSYGLGAGVIGGLTPAFMNYLVTKTGGYLVFLQFFLIYGITLIWRLHKKKGGSHVQFTNYTT